MIKTKLRHSLFYINMNSKKSESHGQQWHPLDFLTGVGNKEVLETCPLA